MTKNNRRKLLTSAVAGLAAAGAAAGQSPATGKKVYGKGRVFYSTLGHTNESWDDPDITKMYFEAIKWVLGMTDGPTAPHTKTPLPAGQ